MTSAPTSARKLDQLDREELLATSRQLLAEAQALSSRIAALNEISIAINRTFDLGEILQVVTRQSKWLLDYEHFSACLHDDKGGWRVVTLYGNDTVSDLDSAALLQTDNLGSVLRTGQSRLITQAEPGMFLEGYSSQMLVPLMAHGKVTGTIHFATRKPRAYKQDDLRISYMLALQLASAISNADHVQELNRIHAEMESYTHELETSNQELDAYNHTIAHDLKSPLTVIGLSAEMVQRIMKGSLLPKADQHLETIKDSSHKMAEMIEQLLWLAKSRNAQEALMPVDVQQHVEAAIRRFKFALEAQRIEVIAAPNLPDVMGHGQWVEEIFANLISNAIKYMGHDKPYPSIRIQALPQGDCVRFEVIDTGIGISAENQARLFEMFTRLHTIKAEGLGLGLSIIHRMVKRMNGDIGVESVPGVGSTFWFTLPAVTVSQGEHAAAVFQA